MSWVPHPPVANLQAHVDALLVLPLVDTPIPVLLVVQEMAVKLDELRLSGIHAANEQVRRMNSLSATFAKGERPYVSFMLDAEHLVLSARLETLREVWTTLLVRLYGQSAALRVLARLAELSEAT